MHVVVIGSISGRSAFVGGSCYAATKHAVMNEDAIEKAGFEPIKPKLDAIAALKSGADVADYITKSYAEGDGQVFQFGSGADFKHAQQRQRSARRRAGDQIADHVIGFDRTALFEIAHHRGAERRAFFGEHAACFRQYVFGGSVTVVGGDMSPTY